MINVQRPKNAGLIAQTTKGKLSPPEKTWKMA
jgi:hypothetical protein